MHWILNLPLRRKLMLVIMLTCVASLLLAVTAFVALDQFALRRLAVDKLATLGRITGGSVAPALVFRDREAAQATLAPLQSEPEIIAAAVYGPDGKLFAKIESLDVTQSPVPTVRPRFGHEFIDGRLEVVCNVSQGGKAIGAVLLRSNLRDLHDRLNRLAWIILGVLIGSTLVALLLSRRLQRMISDPIIGLAKVAAQVDEQDDYTLRAAAGGGDETGHLIATFNRMLAGIQDRDARLQEAKTELEHRVLERTAALEQQLTIRRQAETELEHLLSLHLATLDSTADGILVLDRAGEVVTCNQKFAEMWGASRELIAPGRGQQLGEFIAGQLKTPDSFRHRNETTDELAQETHDILEFNDGRMFEGFSHPHRVGGEVRGRVWSFRDITARRLAEAALRESEEKLQQAQKMDAIGRLAGGVAHDFNNILTVINGYSELLLRRADPQHESRRFLEEINQAGERAASLTRQLLAFSRKQVLQPRVLDLNHIVTGMQQMLQRLIGENIELCTQLEPDLAAVRADPGQIEQVILNLSVNARDAMPTGGRLTLCTANLLVGLNSPVPGQGTLLPGAYVVLSVTDNGVGMTPEVQAHLFEPFFTTKGVGKGTGLGLATCYGIVKQSDGDISVSTGPGRGTTVSVYLPQVGTRADAARPGVGLAAMPQGSETVLLVEDEPALRELAVCVLRDCGYTVLDAGNGRQALQVVESSHSSTIQLVVTDVIMPQMGGTELVKRLKGLLPDCRVLFTSGYTDDALVQHGVPMDRFAFLEKPFSPSGLAQKVRAVLDAPLRN